MRRRYAHLVGVIVCSLLLLAVSASFGAQQPAREKIGGTVSILAVWAERVTET